MNDEQVTNALNKLTGVLANPDVSPVKIARHIVQCQALSSYFAIKARYYMGIGKGEPDAAARKNFYMTLKESFGELSNALKYINKAGQ